MSFYDYNKEQNGDRCMRTYRSRVVYIFLFVLGCSCYARADSMPTLFDIPVYQIAITCDEAQVDQIMAQCQAREISVSTQEPGKLVSQRFLDYKEAQLLRNRFQLMGLTAETRTLSEPYDRLLQSGEFPREEFATFTDLASPPSPLPDIDSQAVYRDFLRVTEAKGVTRPERIQALEPFVNTLRFHTEDG